MLGAHLASAPSRGNQEGCIDGGPQAHHEEELSEDSVDLYSIVHPQAA